MALEMTPERLVLAAILKTMKPARRARVLDLIGDIEAENIINLRRPGTTAERNEIVRAAQRIVETG